MKQTNKQIKRKKNFPTYWLDADDNDSVECAANLCVCVCALQKNSITSGCQPYEHTFLVCLYIR